MLFTNRYFDQSDKLLKRSDMKKSNVIGHNTNQWKKYNLAACVNAPTECPTVCPIPGANMGPLS
jgi:hypothetical protein